MVFNSKENIVGDVNYHPNNIDATDEVQSIMKWHSSIFGITTN